MRHLRKMVQAKHIPDEEFVAAVDRVSRQPYCDGVPPPADGRWCHTDDLAREMPGMPWKVILAKARRVISRDLVEGCTCGCRGDFEVTDKGRELLSRP